MIWAGGGIFQIGGGEGVTYFNLREGGYKRFQPVIPYHLFPLPFISPTIYFLIKHLFTNLVYVMSLLFVTPNSSVGNAQDW